MGKMTKSSEWYEIFSIQEWGNMLSRGEISKRTLRDFYARERRTAKSRIQNLKRKTTIEQFGEQEIPEFEQVKNLKNTESLVRELVDVLRFNRKSTSTIGGLKRQRAYNIEALQEMGVDVDESNYAKWREFIEWFSKSEYSKKYDYQSPALAEVFENAPERATARDYERLFESYDRNISKRGKRRKYN